MSTSHRGHGVSNPVEIDLPAWFAGGNPLLLQNLCGWIVQKVPGVEGRWRVQTQESSKGTRPNLLQVRNLGAVKSQQSPDKYNAVLSLAQYDAVHPGEMWEVARELDDHVMRGDPAIFELLATSRNLIAAAPSAADLRDLLPQVAHDRLLPAVPNGSMYLVSVNSQLGARYSVARSLLRLGEPYEDLNDERGGIVRSSLALFSDTTVGLSSYLSPLFASSAPKLWALPASRGGGALILMFGEFLAGENPAARDLLNMLEPDREDVGALPLSEIGADEAVATLRWWVKQLNVFFSEATNLSNYAPDGTALSAELMVEKLLNLEQCFRNCQTLATLRSDPHARRLVAFSALESFGGVARALSWEQTYSLPKVEAMLQQIESAMPPKVATLLLPRARRGVEGLRRVQDGFFARSRLCASGEIELFNRDGRRVRQPLHAAAKQWLRVVRNSHHGFDKTPANASPRDRDLLAVHDGVVPPGLADLPWLVLLYVMTFPEVIRRGVR